MMGGGRGIFGGRGGGGYPENVNINHVGGGFVHNGPTAFEAWEKTCDDRVALTNEIWRIQTKNQDQMYEHRETDVAEKFGIYKSLRDLYDAGNEKLNDTAFRLYKGNRDSYDELNNRYAEKFAELDKKVAVMEAIRPYQDKLIQCDIEKSYASAINYTDKKTCRCIYGVVGLPSKPTEEVFPSVKQCCDNL